MAPIPQDDFALAGETAVGPDEVQGEDAGAAGDQSGGGGLSRGGWIAIVTVVSVVAVLGISMSVLYYMTKKREWQLRDKMRRSARKVITALTPRRSEFPRSIKEGKSGVGRGKNAGRLRLDDVPPTPRLKPEDVEKAMKSKAKGIKERWGGQ